jgi:type IV pilus assembly protein PilY1
MKPRHFASAAKVFLPLLCLVSLCLLTAPATVQGEGIIPPAMQNYCAEPPFAAAGIKSNLLLMLDNSASMYDLAYMNESTSDPTYCLDDTYRNDRSYAGYFDPLSIYTYDSGKERFQPVKVTLPYATCNDAKCVASTGYLYLEMAPAVAPAKRTVSNFIASGNFLNWLSASKADIQRKVLTGGKFVPDPSSPTKGALHAETRGCQGKRFVKMINGINATFVVRGPMSEELGFTYDTSRGGGTIIEIYDGVYRKKECLDAVRAWSAPGDKKALKTTADACMNAGEETGPYGQMPSQGLIFSTVMTQCFDSVMNKVAVTADQALWALCVKRWRGLFGDYVQPEQLDAVDGFCGRDIKHTSGANWRGFAGRCAAEGGALQNTNCFFSQTNDYCNEIRKPTITDPSSTATMSGPGMQVPSFILDAGIYYLGTPSGSYRARVLAESPPTGMVQGFSGSINFGAMVFNANGAAGTECGEGKLVCGMHCSTRTEVECHEDWDCGGEETCEPGVDGARILSYITEPASSSADLIGAINSLKGSTWTPYAEAFYNAIGYYAGREDLRLSQNDFNLSPAPPQLACRKNNILIISDGMSTADSNPEVEALASLYKAGREAVTGKEGNIPLFEGSRSLDDLAWIAAHRKIRSFSKTAASTAAPAAPNESITTHVIFTGISNGASGEADPATLMRRTAESGGGVFATASDPALLNEQMLMVLRQVAYGTSSGTDVSIQTGGGNGAIFLQEQYFPRKSFDGDTSASWIGEMQGLWYYIDPFIANSSGGGSTVREETVKDNMLILRDDRMLTFGDNAVSAVYDRNGDGNGDGAAELLSPDAVNALWRAGRELWSRDLQSAPRRIFTPLLPGGTAVGNTGLMKFSFQTPDHSAVLQPYLQSATAADAAKLMKYVHGFDFPGDTAMRSRTVRIGNIPAPTFSRNPRDPYVTNPRDYGIGVWKLGDIISSTAKVESSTPLSSYDLPRPRGYDDRSYRSYLQSSEYGSRGMIYLGANDGMLHAFKMGRLKPGTGAVAALLDPGGATPGEEAWAFIPRNVLPYLTYLKEPAYQHLYLVDGAVTLADVSIGDTGSGSCSADSYWNCLKEDTVTMTDPLDPERAILDPAKNSWRTVLIGSMGLGGASSGSCGDARDPAGTGAPCVPTPIADPADSSKRLGYSSYFALDVTDPANPSLLWEFSHPGLGFSTTGAAIVRVGDPKRNGRWFAVFGSGPTGAVRNQQFLGQSNQELKFFVVDLRSGKLVATIPTGIPDAFAGSVSEGVIDDRWTGLLPVYGGVSQERGLYQDDAIYVGYTAFHLPSRSWTRGGVGRIMIKDLPAPAQVTESSFGEIWEWSRVLGYHPGAAPSDSTGPVTTGIARLQDTKHKNLWLYFGSGRYYYRSFEQDDFTGRRALYGVKEPCYRNQGNGYLDKSCSATVCGSATTDCLTDQSAGVGEVATGWRIDLDPAAGTLGGERVVEDPVSMTGGAVFFPTFQPSSAACSMGNSFLWGVRYDTGGAIPAGWLLGKVLMQLSSGELREAHPGGLGDKGNRRAQISGNSKPGGIRVVTNSGLKPLRKIIHIQER